MKYDSPYGWEKAWDQILVLITTNFGSKNVGLDLGIFENQ
jgi:hypothetical protein